ncbi:tRNA wybutosine-synthesizing protein 2/3/4 [Linum perenne]
MEFEKRKAATLSLIASSEVDKSPKGFIDEPIIPLLNLINSHPSYFTTSSCSGRISILSQPKPSSSSAPKKKARGGSWLFITHDPADASAVVSLVFPPPDSTIPDSSHELVFRFEPLIIAVECRDVDSAQSLVSLAISSGFRESGITSASKKRVIVGIRCSIRMEVPLGDSDNVLVSRDYVKFLVGVANQKMEANWKRTQGFFAALRETGFLGGSLNAENGQCDLGDNQVGTAHHMEENAGNPTGLIGVPDHSITAIRIPIVGESVEKLFLWGHTSCTLGNINPSSILVFGGFGGKGRHARRNESLLLDPSRGILETVDFDVGPSPRLGHTASVVGDLVFIIGGRTDPLNILNEVWFLDMSRKQWSQIECGGSCFPPRHRHAAGVVGSKIYVFGGLNNDSVFSSFHVFDTVKLLWKEVVVGGDQPCARHSHSMVAHKSKLFMFGGHNGEQPLGELYSLDVDSYVWKKEKPAGRSPSARFSHSMFVYNNFIGIIGGCPVNQHFQDLALLDVEHQLWSHVRLNCIGRELLVRSTTSVVDDSLVLIGGGAACYAFGTKFTEPLTVDLLPLASVVEKNMSLHNSSAEVNRENNAGMQQEEFVTSSISAENDADSEQQWVLQLKKKYAKLGKDILKKFGWLDLRRKVYSLDNGLHICFPITGKFSAMFTEKQYIEKTISVDQCDIHLSKRLVGDKSLLTDVSCSTAFSLLQEFGGTKLADKVTEVRKVAKSPSQMMKESVASLIEKKGLSQELLDELPVRWECLGDIVVLPITSFKDPVWDSIREELWPIIATSLNAVRLARQGRVASNGTRDSTLELLVGDSGWVDHKENGVIYSFDVTKCMFSWGNLSEKLRMGRFNCEDEVVVDLFAGIGYFVLPFLVRAKAKLVYACEWNPKAVEALKRNLELNSVSDRCVVLEGDNRLKAPTEVADRVCLGLIPTSEGSWETAIKALKKEGGILHVHGNVKDSEEATWTQHVVTSLDNIAKSEGRSWEVVAEHVERVKWYAPHIRHVVVDVRCSPIPA